MVIIMIRSYVQEKQAGQKKTPISNSGKDDMQMRDEYEIRKLDPRRNPYAKETKKQISIKIDQNVIDYFKELSSNNGIPYQTLINMYLSDCVINKKKPDLSWK